MEIRQNSTDSTLSTEQLGIVAALVRGATVTSATKAAGVDRSTFYVWMKTDPNFVAELNRAQMERDVAVRAQLHCLVDPALRALYGILAPECDIPPAVRLKAALEILARTGAQA